MQTGRIMGRKWNAKWTSDWFFFGKIKTESVYQQWEKCFCVAPIAQNWPWIVGHRNKLINSWYYKPIIHQFVGWPWRGRRESQLHFHLTLCRGNFLNFLGSVASRQEDLFNRKFKWKPTRNDQVSFVMDKNVFKFNREGNAFCPFSISSTPDALLLILKERKLKDIALWRTSQNPKTKLLLVFSFRFKKHWPHLGPFWSGWEKKKKHETGNG